MPQTRARQRGRIDTSVPPVCQRNRPRRRCPSHPWMGWLRRHLMRTMSRGACLQQPMDPSTRRRTFSLAHLHPSVETTFTRAPKPARQAALRPGSGAKPLGLAPPAQPDPKLAKMSCDHNWIARSRISLGVVLERGAGPRPPKTCCDRGRLAIPCRQRLVPEAPSRVEPSSPRRPARLTTFVPRRTRALCLPARPPRPPSGDLTGCGQRPHCAAQLVVIPSFSEFPTALSRLWMEGS